METSSLEGRSLHLYSLPPPSRYHPPPSQAISSRDTSTNVTQTRNLSLPRLPLAARAHLPLAERQLQSKHATNASNLRYRVTVPILAVSLSPFHSLPRLAYLSLISFTAKCVHRKTRCTYVKFHRQTAPLGPGHPARPPNDSSNPALPSLGVLPSGHNPYRLSDPFFLPNNGSTLNPSAISQSGALYVNHQFNFPPPLQASAPASYDNSLDYTARYRAQADLLSRAGVIPQDRAPPLPAIYQDSQAPQDPNTAARYGSSYHVRNHDYPLPPSPNGVDYGYNIDNKVGLIYDCSHSPLVS